MTLSIAWLIWSVEKESWPWAAAAGAATGVAYLCKSFLSLTPLGVVGTVEWQSDLATEATGPHLMQGTLPAR